METQNDGEYQESTSITFEWTVKGLKNLFDSTKGESKSKATKSMKFGGGRWQILFYPNAGPSKDKDGSTDATGSYISLYLSCEPTVEEKEKALNDGKWVREGTFKFSFELTNINKTTIYSVKEAHNHTFTYKTANWGWAQFARRDNVYYNSTLNKARDTFVIVCVITSVLTPSSPPPSTGRKFVPTDLLDTVGTLLDDPTYSDVEFILPRRAQSVRNARRIFASKRILSRASYFDAMFNAGFAEGASGNHSIEVVDDNADMPDDEPCPSAGGYNDSDEEDDDVQEDTPAHVRISTEREEAEKEAHLEEAASGDVEMQEDSTHTDDLPQKEQSKLAADAPAISDPHSEAANPSSTTDQPPLTGEGNDTGPKKQKVIVRDVAYTTYRAVLYWLYTDTIVFAPLSSSFTVRRKDAASPVPPVSKSQTTSGNTSTNNTRNVTAPSRREWIVDWMNENPGKLRPCSAKAVYRLADRLDLTELKERAAKHIFKSLTVDNIAYEVFSPFAAAFDDIRKFEVEFFLENWARIRDSKAMRDVWQQIRVGHHPGFEEVWPVIVQNLEFVQPSKSGTLGESGSKG